MRINMKMQILDYDEKAIPLYPQSHEEAAKPKDEQKAIPPMTLGNMCIAALNNQHDTDKALTAEQKVHRAVISVEIHKAMRESSDGYVDLLHEDIVEIKKQMNYFYTPLPLMRAFDLFDPKVEEVKGDAENKAE